MDAPPRYTVLADRARQALYATAFAVSIGSIWTAAWANALAARAAQCNAPVASHSAADFDPSPADAQP